MKSNQFKSFLSQLGYSELLPKEVLDSFYYSVDTDTVSQRQLTIPYFYFEKKEKLFQKHLELWNKNNCPSFVAVLDNETYIIDSRQKPDSQSFLPKSLIIESFSYGVNTPGYNIEKHLHLISRESVDNSEYFSFVITQQRRKKGYEVDKELLLNLLALRKDLSLTQNEKIDLLLLRCLFVKYLEDRGAFAKGNLLKALESGSPEQLIRTFAKVRKINGDLFNKNELSANDIKLKYLQKLSDFFGYTDYQKKQIKFFPYQFDKIPIQLISHIYESFLSEEMKKGSGIYYTPSFLVDFMLSQTLQLRLEKNVKTTFLDPACGSAAYLVSAFRMIVKANGAEKNYKKKKEILQKQIFGIDIDERALPIAAFSLYLALLEGEDSTFIQEKIENEAPILPDLIGNNLIRANSLTEDVVFKLPDNKTIKTFNCIAANPPWGSIAEDDTEENKKTREAIRTKEIFINVSDYQRSQAFLLRTKHWSREGTIASMVVNNSIFFNEKGEGFRKELLSKHKIDKFFELSDINPILFKKRSIGKIREGNKDKNIEVGASEPCCVVVYETDKQDNSTLQYISPKLNDFAKNLRLISYCQKDIVEIKQIDLIQEDLLWKIFVSGNWSEYQIIKKRVLEKDERISIECHSGGQPQDDKKMKSVGKVDMRDLIKPADFDRYRIKNKKLDKFNWARKLRRKPSDSIFSGERILIPVRPLKSDELRFRAIRYSNLCVHWDNILSIKISKVSKYIDNYKPFLAIINSKYLGFLFYHLSSQWGKGDAKRSTLRNSDVEDLPFPSFEFSDSNIKELSRLVSNIERAKSTDKDVTDIENKIDEIVFDLYHLTEYERTVVNEFYEIFYRQESSQERVKDPDLVRYTDCFHNVFRLMLGNDYDLTCKHKISPNLGAVVCFTIQNKKNRNVNTQFVLPEVLEIVKYFHKEKAFVSSALAEEKVKYYDKTQKRFYIIKSNQFRDWTERQAIDDANEEIGDIINYLKEK
jgi:hypothetical protein